MLGLLRTRSAYSISKLQTLYALRARFLSSEIKIVIEDTIKANDVCVFMKGTQEQPMCGFSGRALQILEMAGVSKMKTVNILENEELRNGLKEFSQWPTFPQVYVSGEFVGGVDILMDMHRKGELETLLQKEGIVLAR